MDYTQDTKTHKKVNIFLMVTAENYKGYYPINLYVILSASWLDILIALPILSVMN